MKIPNNAFKFLPLITLLMSVSAFSAEMCVGNRDQLNQALLLASINEQDDVIMVLQGNYVVETTGFFEDGFQYLGADEDFDLEISGGWLSLTGSPCWSQSNNPFSTILDGDGLRRVLNVEMGNADVTLSNLWIFNGYYEGDLFVAGGGLRMDLGANTTAKIERIIISGNYAVQAAALIAGGVGGSRIYLTNSLIVANLNDDNSSVVSLSASENYVINNTIISNTGAGLGVYLSSGLGFKAFLANNILWDNLAYDYAVFGGDDTELYLYNNNLGVLLPNLPINTIQAANISVTPQFEAGLLNFTPVSNSPLVNAGKSVPFAVPIPPPFELAWHYGLFDIEGGNRVNDSQVDIGAFESPEGSFSDLIFANDFE